jgi:hypothetical protein
MSIRCSSDMTDSIDERPWKRILHGEEIRSARTIVITDDMNLPVDQQSQQELPTGQGKENA